MMIKDDDGYDDSVVEMMINKDHKCFNIYLGKSTLRCIPLFTFFITNFRL